MKFNPKAKLAKNLFAKNIKFASTRDGYGEGLVFLGENNEKVVVLCADLTESTRTEEFAKLYPKRFIQVGVAEQNLAGVGAGIAHEGYIPFISSFAVFSPGRNWDQIRVSICYSNINVKIASTHAGLSVGPDGATHQALEDIAITRVLPNMSVVVPADALEAKKATIAISELKGPCYLRLGRPKTPIFTTKESPFKIGQAEVLKDGKDVVLIGSGPLLYEALVAAGNIEKNKNFSVAVINCHTVKPLDKKTILKYAKKTGAVVTIEDHQISGGLGGAVAEFLSEENPVPIRFVGMPDSFGESGDEKDLLEKYGMQASRIEKLALEVIKSKK